MSTAERPPPQYQLITQGFRDRIASGALKEGDQLPSVREISAQHGVAHATAAKVLSTLRAEGLVVTSTGGAGGTFVAPSGLGRTARDRLTQTRRAGHIYPDGEYARIKAAGVTSAPDHVADALGVDRGSLVVYRQRVTYSSHDRPVSASTSWFPGVFAEQAPDLLKAERIRLGTPGYIERCTGRTLDAGRDQNAAGAADETAAADLGIPLGAPILRGRNWYRDTTGEVVEYGESVAVADRWQAYDYRL